MTNILIYSDEGASPFCVHALRCALQQEGITNVHLVNRTLFHTTDWYTQTRLIIFPGGRDVYYHQVLQGSSNACLAAFVRQGGRFLGICAGGYYGSAYIDFERGGPLEVHATRELKFFAGTACGPIYGLREFDYHSHRGARIASLLMEDGSLTAAYYHGGCAFINPDPSTTVLARYADLEGHPPAIIQCAVGTGYALLCGIHPEYSALHKRAAHHLAPHLSALHAIESQRRHLVQYLLNKLLAYIQNT